MLTPVPTAASIASSSPASRPFVLAALRALRLDPDCGCRTARTAGNDPKNGHMGSSRNLTVPALSGMTIRKSPGRSAFDHEERSEVATPNPAGRSRSRLVALLAADELHSKTTVRAPRVNAIAERFLLLGRTLIINQRHVAGVLAEYQHHSNSHRPHRALGQAAPL